MLLHNEAGKGTAGSRRSLGITPSTAMMSNDQNEKIQIALPRPWIPRSGGLGHTTTG